MTAASWIVIGLGFGDEGKGSLVDHLVRRTGAGLVVRFNGGPQAAHHVVTPEGWTHCFAQVGAGSFVSGVETFLASPMFVDPLALERELRVLEDRGLRDIRSRLWVDPGCPLVTPYHAWLNQMRELARGRAAHGTCGRGVGEAFADFEAGTALHVGDLFASSHLCRRLRDLRDSKLAAMVEILPRAADPRRAEAIFGQAATAEVPVFLEQRYRHCVRESSIRFAGPEIIRSRLSAGRTLVFEGAQGLLLDRAGGFWPHVTPSDTSSRNAHHLLAQAGNAGPVHTIGALRAYLTRHGAGPMVTEEPTLTECLPEPHNPSGGWQGPMRCGWFDAVTTRYALSLDPAVDHLAITCMDRLDALREVKLCRRYRVPGQGSRRPITDLDDISCCKSGADMTELLARCAPDFVEVEGPTRLRQEAVLSTIERLIGQRVSLLSRGPTSVQKTWRHFSDHGR